MYLPYILNLRMHVTIFTYFSIMLSSRPRKCYELSICVAVPPSRLLAEAELGWKINKLWPYSIFSPHHQRPRVQGIKAVCLCVQCSKAREKFSILETFSCNAWNTHQMCLLNKSNDPTLVKFPLIKCHMLSHQYGCQQSPHCERWLLDRFVSSTFLWI